MSIPASSQDKKAFLEALNQRRGIEKLLAVVARLRHPTEGCPWDLKQTHRSLKPYMLEECYEAVEAVDLAEEQSQPGKLEEELGDVLLQVALHAQLGAEAGTFDFDSVSEKIAEKLIRRHPHVFADVVAEDAETVTANWEVIKQQERGTAAESESILKGVSRQQPALSQALETSKRAVKVGFEWPNLESLWECVMSEFDELKADIAAEAPHDKLEDEMGDILFACVNLARHFKIDPETALVRATGKFTRRFQVMERLVREQHGGKPLEELDFQTWDDLWNAAKRQTAPTSPISD